MFTGMEELLRGNPRPNAVAFFEWHWLGRKRLVVAMVVALFTAILTFHSGLSPRTDEQLRLVREDMLDRPASGKIHILEIDAKSIAALKSWPWPRRIHGEIVDRLADAGAEAIAFDVDFSSPSVAAEDRRFAEALERFHGTIILPTFVQKSASGSAELSENLPIDQLRANAFLASVNVQPDGDGTIRNIGFGNVTGGIARPTMAAVLANANGDIDRKFRIDTSIDPASLPRHSVIDVLRGKIPSGGLKGKSIFIGATAIELGDRYAMPRHGVQPGVVIQALAAETLMHRNAFITLDQWLSLCIALGFAFLAATRRYLKGVLIIGASGVATLLLIPLVLEFLAVATIDIALGLYALLTAMGVCVALHILGRFNHIRLVDVETGYSNERAMARAMTAVDARFVVVMHIENFSDLAAMLGSNGPTLLFQNVADTLKLGSGDAEIFQLGKGTLGWLSLTDDTVSLTETIDGLRTVLAAKIMVGTDRVIIDAYFGLAPISNGETISVINNATLASHQAAIAGTRWTIFNEDMSDRNGYVQHVLAGLDDAMTCDDIYLLYQPKWSLSDNKVVGVEALVRWNHAVLGPVSPGEFIPVLEQHAQMAGLTLHIAKMCGELAKSWQKKGCVASISMNVSAPLFVDAAFTRSLIFYLKSLGAARRLIMFEITESAAVTNDMEVIASLQKFRQIGIKVSIDDYGTGQSTLSYLQKFPADEIKIDQSFVRNLLENRSDQILVRSTVELGHELGLKVIAEGVENAATLKLLEAYGCDMAQGWLIGRPMIAADVQNMIASSGEADVGGGRAAA